jgi:hypothetical protein
MFNNYASLYFMAQLFATFHSYNKREQSLSAPGKENVLETHYAHSMTKIMFKNKE